MRISSHVLSGGLLMLLCAALIANWSRAEAGSYGEVGFASEASIVFLPIINRETAQKGIWISNGELANLPTSGSAWQNLKEAADENPGSPDLSDRSESVNTVVLAKALVYARTGESEYRNEVRSALHAITFGSMSNQDLLALARNLAAYVIAADLIELPAFDPAFDAQFRDKLVELLNKNVDGDTLRNIHERRANNWGTNAGAARAAVAIYLDDQSELERTAQVFKGFLGDRETYAGFNFDDDPDDLSWQCDPMNPVPVNPSGCFKNGIDISGALPDEMRRGGPFQWPPLETNYPWGSLQGAVVQAHILHRAGYPAWQWEDNALLRAVQFLYNIGWPAEGDDDWQIWLINKVYGTNFPTRLPGQTGKNMGWTEWTHAP
jgi:hypothetical protein